MEDITLQTKFSEALDVSDLDAARALLDEMHPSEIADLLESFPARDRKTIWQLIEPEAEGDVLTEMSSPVRVLLMEQMQPQELAEVTRELEADDVADILQELPDEVMDTVLLSMDAQNRDRLTSVLSYPEDTAAGLMNIDVVSVRADVSMDVVARYLRQLGTLPERTDSLMVVDRENRYLGVLWLSDILTTSPEATVGEHMTEEIGIVANTPAHEVTRIFEQRDLLSAAVVDERGKLLGRITVDDVVDVIQEEADQTVHHMAGLAPGDMFAPVLVSTRRRALWLGVNLLTALLASWVVGRFQNTIQQLVALAVLMPIVASMGGIAGSQTLTIAIRGLALGQLSQTNAPLLIAKEVAVGALNGLAWAMIVATVAALWFDNVALGLVIGLAMIINLIVAALAGAFIPITLKRLGIDPALAGGVLLTTITDVVGFMTFLGLATLLLLPR